jgi:hypothetical protein
MTTNKVERTSETKARKTKTPKLKLSTTDGNLNTKLVAEDALEVARVAYKRLMQIVNGQKVRGIGDEQVKYPLGAMSDARRKYYEDQFAALHESAFQALQMGKRVSAAAVNVPD